MASEEIVKRTLQSSANMFNKGSWWVNDSLKMWMIQLENIDDRDLIIGTKNCLRKAKKLPTVANLIDIIDADPRTTSTQPPMLDGCPACDGSGCRQMARWYTVKGKTRVFYGLAACDCAKGNRLSMGAFDDWRDVRDSWQRDKWTDQIFYSTAQKPHLTTDQTISPEQLEERAQRAREAVAKMGTRSSWRTLGDSTPQAFTE